MEQTITAEVTWPDIFQPARFRDDDTSTLRDSIETVEIYGRTDRWLSASD
jgi:hypothetical protein